MIKIFIVEDEQTAAAALTQFLHEYAKKESLGDIEVTYYSNAVQFLTEYKANADIIFMDIKMPGMSGLDAAGMLRARDNSAILIFVTDMVQYAVDGYSVDALDFIVKPVSMQRLNAVMKKAVKQLEARQEKEVLVKNKGTTARISVSSIRYIEVRRHLITYHTDNGNYDTWGSLDAIEKELPENMFSRCNVGYLVGLKHVKTIEGDEVIVGAERLKISRMRKKDFTSDIAKYFGMMV